MKKICFLLFFSFLLVGCQRSTNQTWENVKTAKNYLSKGISSLFGKNSEAILIEKEEEFAGPEEEEYIPLSDKDLTTLYQTKGSTVEQSKIVPGKDIKELSKFEMPQGNLLSIFKNINFDTDDHVLKKENDLIAIKKIADYLKKNKNVFVAIEGHCDERASASYNMALGTRRANHIRVLLIKNGVDLNRLYSVSYGKERPLISESNSSAWSRNRRVEFKIFRK